MEKIYIVDAVNFLFRSYYAIRPMTNPKGESTNALFGFIRSMFKLMDSCPCDYFVAVFDGPDNKKSRTDIYSEYKSHRTKMPEDLIPQLQKALEFCEIAGIPFLSISGVEADDTIGTIAKWAEGKGATAYVCSSDKDLCQLVNDQIFVLNPNKENLVIDSHQVKEIFGVKPEQIIDLLAMMGDASDNIPGLTGFGPKTAVSLLNQFGTLEEILKNPEKVPGKKGETLIQEANIALLSKQLATLHLNVPIPQEEDFFHLKTPNLKEVKAFYHEMGFLSLLRELEEPKEESKQQIDNSSSSYRVIDTLEELKVLIQALEQEKEICIDTETTSLDPMQAKIVGIGIGASSQSIAYIPFNGNLDKQKALALLKPLLESQSIGFIGHNLKYDLHVLLNEGIVVKRLAFDTMIASYLLAPHTQRHNLDELSLQRFGKVKIPIEELIGKGKKQIPIDQVPIEKVAEYCSEDVDYTLKLKEVFKKELNKMQLETLFYEIELPLLFVLLKMERNGIFVNKDHLKKMSSKLISSISHLEKKIFDLAGESFNLNSPKQLSHILFDKLKIKPPKKTATGFSTAADVLESLQSESLIVKEILEYRLLEKLRSTYVDALVHDIDPKTHRIHCTFNQSVAATGRLSCQNPNLQNIPIRSSQGKELREAFCPQYPRFSFLSADYSQIELRLLAHLSEDPVLIKAFKENEDIHTFTASLIFEMPLVQVTPQMRYQAKAVNFGILYGQSAFGLSQLLGIDYSEAVSFIEAYFARYPTVRDYLEFCKESVRKTGHAITLIGRQRPIPEIDSRNPAIRHAAERLAVNTPLQGTAADLIKMAMLDVHRYLEKNPHQGLMILQIHDELLFESQDEEVKSLGIEIKNIMERVLPLKVPLVVDISIGRNWGEC